jgi:hypothetical protein
VEKSSCVLQTASARAGFRHVQEVQLHRAPTKRGAPTNEVPCVKADSNKGQGSGTDLGMGERGGCPEPAQKGAPTNEGPHAKADSNKGSPRQKGFNALGVGPLELWLP